MIKRKGTRCLIGFESVGKYYLGEQELLLEGVVSGEEGKRHLPIRREIDFARGSPYRRGALM